MANHSSKPPFGRLIISKYFWRFARIRMMISISHRQRVQTALEHREPDVVPLDFGTGGNTSPVPEVYEKLAAIYQIPYDLKLVPHIMRLAVVDERILQDLDIDTRPIYMHPVPHKHHLCEEPFHFYDE
jgi:hypothetical protein